MAIVSSTSWFIQVLLIVDLLPLISLSASVYFVGLFNDDIPKQKLFTEKQL